MTNFERIKQMTIEEMVDSDFLKCHTWCAAFTERKSCHNEKCRSAKIEWLNQEAKE